MAVRPFRQEFLGSLNVVRTGTCPVPRRAGIAKSSILTSRSAVVFDLHETCPDSAFEAFPGGPWPYQAQPHSPVLATRPHTNTPGTSTIQMTDGPDSSPRRTTAAIHKHANKVAENAMGRAPFTGQPENARSTPAKGGSSMIASRVLVLPALGRLCGSCPRTPPPPCLRVTESASHLPHGDSSITFHHL